MNIYEFFEADLKYDIIQLAADEELTLDVQKILIWLKLLYPPADGKFGPISTAALKEFQELMKCEEQGFLGPDTAKKLIETDPTELPQPKFLLSNDLASRIIKYMQSKSYQIANRPGEYNIIYIEGMNANGTENTDLPNQFNDRRMIIQILNGEPKIIGNWEATTEPGRPYTENPPNSRGAARIKFDQYKAWQVDTHVGLSGFDPHEALVQVAPVTVHRDFDRNGIRTGDKLDSGLFGINQHWGFDYPRHDVGFGSAGCLVGRTRQGHKEFMQLIKKDRRYQENRSYMFVSTMIPADDLLKRFPA